LTKNNNQPSMGVVQLCTMMEQAVENERGQRAMECGGGGISDGGSDKGGDSRSKSKDGGQGSSKCDGSGYGEGNGHGDGDGRNHSCIEGNGIGNAATVVAAATKAAKMTETKVMAAAWLQGQ
jgi:hypothetical protein